jgi:hypothetical protein
VKFNDLVFSIIHDLPEKEIEYSYIFDREPEKKSNTVRIGLKPNSIVYIREITGDFEKFLTVHFHEFEILTSEFEIVKNIICPKDVMEIKFTIIPTRVNISETKEEVEVGSFYFYF